METCCFLSIVKSEHVTSWTYVPDWEVLVTKLLRLKC